MAQLEVCSYQIPDIREAKCRRLWRLDNGVVCLPKLEFVQQRQKGKQERGRIRASSELLEPVTSIATPDLGWQITEGAREFLPGLFRRTAEKDRTKSLNEECFLAGRL